MILVSRFLWAFFAIALAVEGFAQMPVPGLTKQSPAQTAPREIADPLGRTTPHDTVVNFIRACGRRDFAQAGEFLDTGDQSERRQQLARMLMHMMNVGLRVNLDLLSENPEGSLDDGLPLTREKVGEVKIDNDSLEILLDRVQRRDNPPIWLFSRETLHALPAFARMHETFDLQWIERYLPEWLVERKPWGISLYRWILNPLFLLLMLGFAWLATRILAFLFRHIFHRFIERNVGFLEVSFWGPARLFLFACLLSLGSHYGNTLLVRQFWNRVATIFIVTAVTWFFLRVFDLIAQSLAIRFRHRIAAIQLLRGLAKGLAVIVALLVILKIQGVDLTTTLAGLGIGGVAIAFAAQKTIENLFGTVMLVGDQPIRVDDFCRVGDTLGTVENIGLRSTRIRTLDRTVVSVPNGQVASMVLENFAHRDKIWFNPTIGLRYETTADQLRYVLANTRKMLYEHPKVESESARIRFVRFGNSSLDLEVFAYVFATDYAVFLEIQEDLLLRIMDVIEASGTGVAFPSQTMYLAKDRGLDAEKSQAAIAHVQRWRDEKDLPFPNYPPEKIAQLQDSLEYPPSDSALHGKK